jgi:hypothetical protein
MPIPSEFNYSNEADFVQRFLIPLLQRLGFSVVVNYHGSREFGKDLIFAEVDRFANIRYHGLQAKYVESIGINDIEDLINDCRQAFANPFRHPHTGATERINTFYAVNGGSISDAARDHFFNSLAHPYGGGLRLLDGVSMLALDRRAVLTSVQNIRGLLLGMLLELRYNARMTPHFVKRMEARLSEHAPIPAERYRLNAIESYLQSLTLSEQISTEIVESYWQSGRTAMRILDGLVTAGWSEETRREMARTTLVALNEIGLLGRILENQVLEITQALGTLCAL